MERIDPEYQAGELAMLGQYLDYHRATLMMKAGAGRRGWRAWWGASELTLAGLVKHLALVEDDWFTRVLLGRSCPSRGPRRLGRRPHWEFHTAPDESPTTCSGLYAEACDRSRAAVAEVGDLTPWPRRGAVTARYEISLRWIMLHMLEETARHNGHADLLRESIDGVTGE